MKHLFSAMVLLTIIVLAASANAQTLTMMGLNGKFVALRESDIEKLSHVKLSVKQHGQDHVFEGVPLTILLERLGVPIGEKLRGADLTDVVLVTAHDGYQVALALAETDPAMSKNRVILADKMDGSTLNAHDGPFRLIVEADQRPARSARMVEAIQLLRIGKARQNSPESQ